MAVGFILLVLPALALANINVEVTGKFDEKASNLKVYYNGNDMAVISDVERITFNLSDNSLKNAVNQYFGKRPDDAFLHSPTPWSDLYQTYGWEQVSRTLAPKSGTILKTSSEPALVRQQIFENKSSKPAVFNVAISQSVQNTASSSWSTDGQLSINKTITYGFKIGIPSGEALFFYNSTWGQNSRHSQSTTIGSTSPTKITLQPGQAVVAELHATKASVQVEVEYDASLSGYTAVNYSKKYKKHHFWALEISDCMSSAKISNQKKSQEVIDFQFYLDSKVIVTDKDIGSKLMEVSY